MTDESSPIALRFGHAVRGRREEVGVSQEDLADRAGLHRTYVSLIERGRRNASIAVVEVLASALGTTMSDLMRETERR